MKRLRGAAARYHSVGAAPRVLADGAYSACSVHTSSLSGEPVVCMSESKRPISQPQYSQASPEPSNLPITCEI